MTTHPCSSSGLAIHDSQFAIIAFCCHYCAYAAADLAGSLRIQYPASVKVIKLPCTGKLDVQLVLEAFERGADGVMIAGCLEGECHYQQGNFNAKRRVNHTQSLLRQVGLEPERVRMFNMSSAMGRKWAEAVGEMDETVRQLGPSPLKVRLQTVRPEEERPVDDQLTAEQVSTYRSWVTLRDGTRILLRLLAPDDRGRLIELFASASPDDLKTLRHPITDADTVGRWVDELDYSRVLPLVAVAENRIVGDASLHFRQGPARHIGEVRIFVAEEFRRRRLCSHMLRAQIDFARQAGLRLLVAEIVATRTKAIKAFREVGFQIQCAFQDFFMFPDGKTSDLMIMTMTLMPHEVEFESRRPT